MTAGQLDLLTGAVAEQRPAPVAPVRRAVKPRLEPGQVRYATLGGQRDCDDCWHDQAAAHDAGKPVPVRRRATGSRETTGGKAYLCELYKLNRQATDREEQV